MIVKMNNLLKLFEILEEGVSFVYPESSDYIRERPDYSIEYIKHYRY